MALSKKLKTTRTADGLLKMTRRSDRIHTQGLRRLLERLDLQPEHSPGRRQSSRLIDQRLRLADEVRDALGAAEARCVARFATEQ